MKTRYAALVVLMSALVLPTAAFADWRHRKPCNDRPHYNPSHYNPSHYNPSHYNPSHYNPSHNKPSYYNPSYYDNRYPSFSWRPYKPTWGYGYNRNPNWNYSSRDHYNPRPNNYGSNGFGANSAINYGIRTGQLSNSEVRDIREDQRELARKASAYRSDGHLSNRERADLRDEYRDLQSGIRHNLNDGERRRW